METEKLELFAIVELFGHQRIAGKITEHNFGPSVFIRIDVPETPEQPKFTRLVNPSAVYAINPVTEEVMLDMAKRIQQKPIDSWDIREMANRLMLLKEKNNHEDDE